MKKEFTESLLQWYNPRNRKMPWKGSKDPYTIWISEIILQQTRVEQGTAYFNRFIATYPTVHQLAKAKEKDVLKLWEGLGYYARARNMHASAKQIVDELSGQFPSSYEELLSLRGVGEYTASAIASFAYNLPYAVVDGNVYRVLARYFGIKIPIDSNDGKKYFSKLAQELLDKKNPGRYNQAIMDFGATQCKPAAPICDTCPLTKNCFAFKKKAVFSFPVKSKKIKPRTRYFNYLVIQQKNSILLRQRTEKDIWKKLYELPLIETKSVVMDEKMLKKELINVFPKNFVQSVSRIFLSGEFRQILTHQRIQARFWEIKTRERKTSVDRNYFFADRDILTNFVFPKILIYYFKENFYI